MPKRKREDYAISQGGIHNKEDAENQNRKKMAAEKIARGKKALIHALKIARGFERQKLGRRSKTAMSEGDQADVKRINAEIVALKALDLRIAAESWLCRHLLRIQIVGASPALPETVRQFKRPLHDTPTANVTARLYNSNPVKKILPGILNSIARALGISYANEIMDEPVHGRRQLVPTNAMNAKSSVNEDRSATYNEIDEERIGFTLDGIAVVHKACSNGSDSGDGSIDEERPQKLSKPRARIAFSSEEYSDVSGDGPAVFSSVSDSGIVRAGRKSSMSESSPPKRSKITGGARFASGTTYLQGLSNVGYVSGSDSEAEDDIDIAPRKNRRGQRARQTLWEKKYGSKAKHLQGQNKDRSDRDQGWDPRRGARDESSKFSRKGRPGVSSKLKTTGANDTPVAPRKSAKTDNEAPLHPSWEAARRAKEQKSNAGFQGTKISFS